MKRDKKIRDHLTKYIAINPLYCMACWECIEECPKKVIGKSGIIVHKHAHIVKTGECIGCKKCIKACPHQAIIELPSIYRDYVDKPNQYTRDDWQRMIIDLLGY
ncbi:MAG TPA: 4Fe-4S binding protein [Syntrophomonadaceae bacterium]|nr:4Fe-4S binding protein [Syntrophomonadaceae bacterium]HQA07389.1 4Fe-4S binding protein [Syntrophomonadaceae bacterium]HQE23516.1 4Fe-4S binding protein [Syntrophomonadaceae bacterium]